MEFKNTLWRSTMRRFAIKFTMILLVFTLGNLVAQDVLTADDLFKLKSCTAAKISPDGKWVAYTVRVQREVNEKAGRAYSELYLISTNTGEIRPFICGKVNVSSPQWSVDGKRIAFLMKRGVKAHTQIWMISATGGEARSSDEAHHM